MERPALRRKLRGMKPNLGEVLEEITEIHADWSREWSQNASRAGAEAAALMRACKFDRLESMARCLCLWEEEAPTEEEEGRLVLAWTNLGALVEGALALLLSFYIKRYREDCGEDAIPERAKFDELAEYFGEHVWTDDEDKEKLEFVHLVRDKRNAIHAFRERDLGNWPLFHRSVRQYLELIDEIDTRMPRPEEYE